MNYFFNCVILSLLFVIFVKLICSHGFAAVGAKNTRLINLNLKTVNIIYYHDFPSKAVELSENNRDCFYLPSHSEIIRCKEHVYLLRSADVVNKWRLQQSRQGYFLFTDSDIGIKSEHAYIIRAYDFNRRESTEDDRAGRVTGKVIRHALNTEVYAFQNLKTHAINTINATVNHRFYVLNRRAFIPISKITPADRLINEAGEKLRLHSPEWRIGKYGVSNSNKRLVSVYNLEVYRHHTYFAGKNRVLVHNGCFDEYSDTYLKNKSAEQAAAFVHEQVKKYVPYSDMKVWMDIEPEDRSLKSALDEKVVAFWQGYQVSGNEGTEQFTTDVGVGVGIGDSLVMSLVGKRVLQAYGFAEPVSILYFRDRFFLELGHEYTNRWIVDPIMRRYYAKSQIYESLVFYVYEINRDVPPDLLSNRRWSDLIAYKELAPVLIKNNRTKKTHYEVGFNVYER